ncbi:MAG TPA: hypothetical protein DHT34_02800, partial [Cellvibrionales bacterium]|nr:hypothetical protein [Cellvibrionales bacterium]
GPPPTVLIEKLNKPSKKEHKNITRVNPDDLEFETIKNSTYSQLRRKPINKPILISSNKKPDDFRHRV